MRRQDPRLRVVPLEVADYRVYVYRAAHLAHVRWPGRKWRFEVTEVGSVFAAATGGTFRTRRGAERAAKAAARELFIDLTEGGPNDAV